MVPSPLRVPQCELVDLLFQAAWNSDGTVGSNTVEIVRIEQFRNGLSVENSTSSPNQQTVTKRFTAISSRSGSYFACKNICINTHNIMSTLHVFKHVLHNYIILLCVVYLCTV